MEQLSRVFVPTVLETSGNAIGLGCFSTEQVAWQVLRSFLKKSEQMSLDSASIVIWDIDVIGHDAMTELTNLVVRECPVCQRKTMWFDLDQYSAICYGTACSAWIEENLHEKDIIDCGFPPTQYLKQTKSIDEAITELTNLGNKIRSAGEDVTNSMYKQTDVSQAISND